jgi:DNA-directed RNA polymerase subunit M/transcription elongation factor TFIIS
LSSKKNNKKRCDNCNTLLIKATVISGIAELECDNCGHVTIISESNKCDRPKFTGVLLIPKKIEAFLQVV